MSSIAKKAGRLAQQGVEQGSKEDLLMLHEILLLFNWRKY